MLERVLFLGVRCVVVSCLEERGESEPFFFFSFISMLFPVTIGPSIGREEEEEERIRRGGGKSRFFGRQPPHKLPPLPR